MTILIYFSFFLKFKSLNDANKKSNWKEIIPLIFEAIDADKDGAISHDEFNNYFKSLNINDRAMAEEVFHAIDTNNDGSLSSDGMKKLLRYYLNIYIIFLLLIKRVFGFWRALFY